MSAITRIARRAVAEAAAGVVFREAPRRLAAAPRRRLAAAVGVGEAIAAVAQASAVAQSEAITVTERRSVITGRPVTGSMVCPTRPWLLPW